MPCINAIRNYTWVAQKVMRNVTTKFQSTVLCSDLLRVILLADANGLIARSRPMYDARDSLRFDVLRGLGSVTTKLRVPFFVDWRTEAFESDRRTKREPAASGGYAERSPSCRKVERDRRPTDYSTMSSPPRETKHFRSTSRR